MKKKAFFTLYLIILVSCVPIHTETILPDTTPTLDSVAVLKSIPCLLPCWQKITPGISKVSEMDAITQTLLGKSPSKKSATFQEREYLAASAGKTFSTNGTQIYFSIGMFSIAKHEIVEILHIWADVIDHQAADTSNGHNAYWQIFATYSLQNILSKYGIPEKVLIFGEVHPEDFLQDRNALHLRLHYASKGIFINFDMPMTKDGDKGIACPKNADFELWLTSPNPSHVYMEFWESAQGYTNFSETFDTPIEDAIHLTTSDLYEQFKASNDACFETPLDTWKIVP